MSLRVKSKIAAATTKLEWRRGDTLTRSRRQRTLDQARRRDLEAWLTTTMMTISEWLRRVQLSSKIKKWRRLRLSFKISKGLMTMRLAMAKVVLRVKAIKGLKVCSLDTNEAVIKL